MALTFGTHRFARLGIGAAACGLLTLLLSFVPAIGNAEKGDSSYSVLLNQDSFFGFYPSFTGLLEMNDTTDFSFYGIIWTKPAFSLNESTGDNLWTEFGAGANFRLLDNSLAIKAQLGITNGALLSGGGLDENGDITDGKFLDGVVPSLTINYASNRWEAEWYSGYYLAARGRDGDRALDFLHLWANGGYKVIPQMSVGLHYELLDNTRNTYDGGSSDVVYEWIGGYLQFALPDSGFFARLSGGSDEERGGDFYKLNVGMSF